MAGQTLLLIVMTSPATASPSASNPVTEDALGRHPITVLMVDDQAMLGEAVRRMLADQEDITFHFCGQPTEALKMAESVKPTVILQDLVMPEVDGLTMVKFFRANPATAGVPMIVLSSREEPDIKYQAFALGANDYMVKLPDKLEVTARIRYHSKAYITRLERDAAFAQLEASQQALKVELGEAERYVRSLFPEKMDTPALKTDWVHLSCTDLGGDALGYNQLGDDHFASYVIDVCGHGVGAALLSVSALNVLRAQTLPGVDFTQPGEVLEAMNNAFDMDRQNQMYFTMWYGVYQFSTRQLVYASGGHPPAILLHADGTLEQLGASGMVVGGMPGMSYETKTATVPPGATLYVFSDGVYEVDYADGRGMMTLEEFADALALPASGPGKKMEDMLAFVRQAQGTDHFEDDFTLVEAKLP